MPALERAASNLLRKSPRSLSYRSFTSFISSLVICWEINASSTSAFFLVSCSIWYTALQLLSVVKDSGKTLAELANDVTTYPQELLNIKVADKTTAMENQKLKEIIAQVEKEMNGDGRVLVRPSGTEPLLRIMAEAATPELVHEYVERIGDVARAELEVE